MGLLTKLTFLWLYNNCLTGSIPSDLCSLTKITIITKLLLQSNKLICYPSCLSSLVSNNGYPQCTASPTAFPTYTPSDADTALCAIVASTNINSIYPTWFCSNGQPSGTAICSWTGITCNGSNISISLSLVSISLKGSIPTEIGLLTNLQYLYLHNNCLSSIYLRYLNIII